jgi:hypothetical protein
MQLDGDFAVWIFASNGGAGRDGPTSAKATAGTAGAPSPRMARTARRSVPTCLKGFPTGGLGGLHYAVTRGCLRGV